MVQLPYSSIWEGSQDVVPRLSRKCTFQLECMVSREFGAVAGSDVLEGRCWWGEKGCDDIRPVVIVELLDKAQGSNSLANLQAWQIGSVSDDVKGSTLDGRKPSQGHGCSAHLGEHGVLHYWAHKAIIHSSAAAGVQDSGDLLEKTEPLRPTDSRTLNMCLE